VAALSRQFQPNTVGGIVLRKEKHSEGRSHVPCRTMSHLREDHVGRLRNARRCGQARCARRSVV
jgi:hypothetical protein